MICRIPNVEQRFDLVCIGQDRCYKLVLKAAGDGKTEHFLEVLHVGVFSKGHLLNIKGFLAVRIGFALFWSSES